MSYIDKLTVTKNDDSTVTIAGDIPYSELHAQRTAAITHLGKDITIDGFRKGNVPEAVLVEKIGEMNLVTEMAERALATAYPHMLTKHTIDAIGYPQVSITKLAPDTDLGFTITVAVVPEFTLPDYRAVAAAHTPTETAAVVTDEDIAAATKDILRRKVAYDRLQAKAAQKAAADTGDLPTPDTVQPTDASDTDAEPADADLPELTDELVQTLGDFESVDAFTTQIRSELQEQKQHEAQNKHRAAITDALVEATTVTIPAVMIDAELEQFSAQMNEDLKRAQLSMEDYLAHIKKTEAELKDEWRPAAEKRATVQLVLDAIANQEEIEPDNTVVTEQVTALKQQYADADEDRIRTYVRTILRNEAVMKLLEGTADRDESTTPTESPAQN